MRIAALTLHGSGSWPTLQLGPVSPGLSVVYGRPNSGKTIVASFLAHVLYGQASMTVPPGLPGIPQHMPSGEAVVENGDARYRLRRFQHGPTCRLTVSSLEGSSVNHETVRGMLGGLSPLLLRRLYAISFSQPPLIERLLSVEFALEFQALDVSKAAERGRRATELLARRDTLAKELETRLASEGQASRDLDARRRELDRLIAVADREGAAINQRFRSVEAALTETDTRLRYRRLEMSFDRNDRASEPVDCAERLADLDEQIVRWRTALADLASREATLRAQLAKLPASAGTAAAIVIDERAWLWAARQLVADLTGEVARLARANSSNQCVCRDAHPRLRPVVETIQRQIEVLTTLVAEHEQALIATELAAEIGQLARSQAELAGLLEQLVERRQALACSAGRRRRPIARELNGAKAINREDERGAETLWLNSADAEQLEHRRHELESDRLELANRLTTQEHRLRDLRAERVTLDRQRAALLSARSIEHVQRELAAVQHKLQQAMQKESTGDMAALSAEDSPRASDILAKLTDGRLVRLQLVEHGRSINVWTREGLVHTLESLAPMERDQVYLSFILALAAAAECRAVRLPLLLDEPFIRFDGPATAALAAVLDDFGRRGQQIIVFTGKQEAADRLASLGAPVFDIHDLRHREHELSMTTPAPAATTANLPVASKKPKSARRTAANGKRSKLQGDIPPPNEPTATDRSNAA